MRAARTPSTYRNSITSPAFGPSPPLYSPRPHGWLTETRYPPTRQKNSLVFINPKFITVFKGSHRPILSCASYIHRTQSGETCFNVNYLSHIFISHYGIFCSLRFSYWNILCITCFLISCYVSCLSQPSRFDDLNNTLCLSTYCTMCIEGCEHRTFGMKNFNYWLLFFWF
jgi:hypothetical protein